MATPFLPRQSRGPRLGITPRRAMERRVLEVQAELARIADRARRTRAGGQVGRGRSSPQPNGPRSPAMASREDADERAQ